jgi:hypothetical protein
MMPQTLKPTHTQPGGFVEEVEDTDSDVVNDSFGTIDIADTTGIEDEMETGEAKVGNFDTRED